MSIIVFFFELDGAVYLPALELNFVTLACLQDVTDIVQPPWICSVLNPYGFYEKLEKE